MSGNRIPNGYKKLSDSALLEKANFFHQQVSSRPTVFATPVPTMVVFKEACDDFQESLNGALTGDSVARSQKKIYRGVLIDKMHQLSNYVQLTANGNPHIVAEAGMSYQKPASPRILGDPTITDCKYTGVSGELDLTTTCANVRSYIYQYTSDPQMAEASWKSMQGISTSEGKITGLTPGTVYFIRVCVIGTNKQVKYSPVISIMAV